MNIINNQSHLQGRQTLWPPTGTKIGKSTVINYLGKRNIIVTFEDEGTVEKGSLKIEVIPAWKFILNKA